MLGESGLTQNQFATKYGYTSGQVSNTHREKADDRYFPRVKLIDVLCTELSERCHVQEGALVALRRLHQETLEALCAVPKPHHAHVLRLTELRNAERITAITYKIGSDQLLLAQLIEERNSLRQDRDDQRERARTLQHQIDELTEELNSLAADNRDCLLRRDGASVELDQLESSDPSMSQANAADLGVFHGKHPSASPAAPLVLPPASERRRPKHLPWIGAVVAVPLLVFAGVGIDHLFGNEGTSTGGTNGKGTSGTSPSQQPSPTPSAQPPRSDTPKPTTTSKQAPPKPLAVGGLNFTGDNWVKGTWSLQGRKYPDSLGWVGSCNDHQQVVIPLPRSYQRFSATVGLDDGTIDDLDRSYPVSFNVWADLNKDGKGDDRELIASPGATYDKPATINAPLKGVTQLILQIETSSCGQTTLVWGSPEVR
ncbi:NPCBM/NEW2 domain-containing protein [Streptomyces sp900105755]|uniref:NPCBM/NEW2 domain-containing protein n=1 Tax=Streptomyces sp. 900105755 TaxID=3154389 RepID=A0ABV1TYI5_9ACTN